MVSTDGARTLLPGSPGVCPRLLFQQDYDPLLSGNRDRTRAFGTVGSKGERDVCYGNRSTGSRTPPSLRVASEPSDGLRGTSESDDETGGVVDLRFKGPSEVEGTGSRPRASRPTPKASRRARVEVKVLHSPSPGPQPTEVSGPRGPPREFGWTDSARSPSLSRPRRRGRPGHYFWFVLPTHK